MSHGGYGSARGSGSRGSLYNNHLPPPNSAPELKEEIIPPPQGAGDA